MIKRGKEIYKIFLKQKRFQSEFQRQFRLFIIVTLGFTVAFTWRQTTFDISLSLVKFITRTQNSSFSSILASIFITIVSIGLIYAASYFLKDGIENC